MWRYQIFDTDEPQNKSEISEQNFLPFNDLFCRLGPAIDQVWSNVLLYMLL